MVSLLLPTNAALFLVLATVSSRNHGHRKRFSSENVPGSQWKTQNTKQSQTNETSSHSKLRPLVLASAAPLPGCEPGGGTL